MSIKSYNYITKQQPPLLTGIKCNGYECKVFIDFILLGKILDERYRRGLSRF